MTIDRIGPAMRPDGRPVGYQRWRSLLFLHWPVPADVLRALVPPSLTIDAHDGVAYVGVVPFAMERVRPPWAPERAAFRFLEANVRTYVHVAGRDPGVYFFSLDAASRVAVAIVPHRWGLPYYHAGMRMARRGDIVEYESRRLADPRAYLRVRWEIGADLGPSPPGTLGHFLLERYLLLVPQHGRLWRGQVHHPAYAARSARVFDLDEGLLAAGGLPPPMGEPLVHDAPGVDGEVFPLRPVSARREVAGGGRWGSAHRRQ